MLNTRKQNTLLLFLLVFVFTNVYSHGGGTNSKGCHNNRKTGDYHCHNSKSKKSNQSSKVRTLLNNNKQANFKCKNKRVCADMINCDEAKFYLKTCDLHKLDGDKDGIPCESICGSRK